jgi:hypothetical protein
MNRPVTTDVDKLAHGQAVAKDAFLALLGDPEAQEDLSGIALTRELLDPSPPDEAAAPGLDVPWDDLAAYAAGTLTDVLRRQAVEKFLIRQAPELLRTGEEPATTVDFAGGDNETTIVAPQPRPKDQPEG